MEYNQTTTNRSSGPHVLRISNGAEESKFCMRGPPVGLTPTVSGRGERMRASGPLHCEVRQGTWHRPSHGHGCRTFEYCQRARSIVRIESPVRLLIARMKRVYSHQSKKVYGGTRR